MSKGGLRLSASDGVAGLIRTLLKFGTRSAQIWLSRMITLNCFEKKKYYSFFEKYC